jgi:hypothetical protein
MLLKYYNLIEMGLLPVDWQQQVMELSDAFSKRYHLDGKHASSREPEGTEGMDVYMVEGDVVFQKANWLYNLYANELLTLANNTLIEEYVISDNLISSVTFNSLRGRGGRYELHVDSNPLTGLLFATTHPKGTGGELVFREKDTPIYINPVCGDFILFDARNIPHEVLPLLNEGVRISIPMNYFLKDQQQADWLQETEE